MFLNKYNILYFRHMLIYFLIFMTLFAKKFQILKICNNYINLRIPQLHPWENRFMRRFLGVSVSVCEVK